MMRLQFLGANKQVTGSRYLLEAAGLKFMVDCGMFQERKYLLRNWEESPVSPKALDYLLLTHAHLDHCGLIPRLVAQGFNSPIITVEPSVDLAKIIMLDAGRIQTEDAQYKKKRHRKEGRRGKYPEIPLYTAEQAEDVMPYVRGVQYNKPVKLSDQVSVTFHQAGHILGSAFLEIVVCETDQLRRVVFSGDLGQRNRPLINDPSQITQADYLVMESTYGDRSHPDAGSIEDQLAEVINTTVQRGGNIVIPTFALERAQELVYHLGQLARTGRIPNLPAFLDSPMAVDVTEVFHRYCRYLNEETRCRVEGGDGVSMLRFPGLKLVRRVQDSIAINHHKGPCIIMASAGMCTGGRIKHHLRQNMTRRESTILFVGYQAQNTLGRQIVDGAKEVRIHGRSWPVRAKIAQLLGLSAHGDREDLLRWLGGFTQPPKHLFLTHGEEHAAEELANTIRTKWGWPVAVPDFRESVELS